MRSWRSGNTSLTLEAPTLGAANPAAKDGCPRADQVGCRVARIGEFRRIPGRRSGRYASKPPRPPTPLAVWRPGAERDHPRGDGADQFTGRFFDPALFGGRRERTDSDPVLGTLAKANRPRPASLHFAGVGIGITASAALVAGSMCSSSPPIWTG
jgi:hypothetical protein